MTFVAVITLVAPVYMLVSQSAPNGNSGWNNGRKAHLTLTCDKAAAAININMYAKGNALQARCVAHNQPKQRHLPSTPTALGMPRLIFTWLATVHAPEAYPSAVYCAGRGAAPCCHASYCSCHCLYCASHCWYCWAKVESAAATT